MERFLRWVTGFGIMLGAGLGVWAWTSNPPGQVRAAAAPTYYGEVQAILEQNCVNCHSEGGIGPFSLTDPKEARKRAQEIAAVTQAGYMPPWMPAGDSPRFLYERGLSEEQKAQLSAWAEAGAPLGQFRYRPVEVSKTIKAPDLTLPMTESYRPSAKYGTDDYHCFLLDPGLDRDVMVTGVDIKPGQPSIVHHVILFTVTGTALERAEQLNAQNGGKGWTCFGGPGLDSTGASLIGGVAAAAGNAPRTTGNGYLGFWVPGKGQDRLPAGTAMPLRRGTKVIMQMHYNLASGVKPDLSSAKLYFAENPAGLRPLRPILLYAPTEIPCPEGLNSPECSRDHVLRENLLRYGPDSNLIALGMLLACGKSAEEYSRNVGNASRVRSTCDRRMGSRMDVFGVAGHMHLRGRAVKLELNPGTPKAQTILDIPAWNFHWQDQYWLEQPIAINPGDVVRVSCSWDNSLAAQPMVAGKPDAPRYITWGEGTNEEMCLGALMVANR
ncbi:MAG: monooxygenase [Meiothermus sp.]|nr:monooxygenase [Meiothermus sp.]